jgi:hypothetical protein
MVWDRTWVALRGSAPAATAKRSLKEMSPTRSCGLRWASSVRRLETAARMNWSRETWFTFPSGSTSRWVILPPRACEPRPAETWLAEPSPHPMLPLMSMAKINAGSVCFFLLKAGCTPQEPPRPAASAQHAAVIGVGYPAPDTVLWSGTRWCLGGRRVL